MAHQHRGGLERAAEGVLAQVAGDVHNHAARPHFGVLVHKVLEPGADRVRILCSVVGHHLVALDVVRHLAGAGSVLLAHEHAPDERDMVAEDGPVGRVREPRGPQAGPVGADLELVLFGRSTRHLGVLAAVPLHDDDGPGGANRELVAVVQVDVLGVGQVGLGAPLLLELGL